MSLMPVMSVAPFTPPELRALAAHVAAAVWYPIHEGTGTTVAEKLGVGPNLTLAGTPGTEWSAVWGALKPNGTDHVLTAPDSAVLSRIFDLSTLYSLQEQLVLAFELQHDGDLTAVECLMTWGRNSGAVGTKGMYTINMNAVEQISYEMRGAEATSSDTAPFPNSAGTGVSTRKVVVITITPTLVATAVNMTHYHQLIGSGSPLSEGTVSDVSMIGNAAIAPPSYQSPYSLTLLARRGASTFDRFAGASSNVSLSNFQAARIRSLSASHGPATLSSVAAAPREMALNWRA